MKKILITGGLGYIGSHTVVNFNDIDCEIVILDNLSTSELSVYEKLKSLTTNKITFINGDIRDKFKLNELFIKERFNTVIHFAGLKSVSDSIIYTLKYYDTNIQGTLTLLNIMDNHDVREFIFSSSATVYGVPNLLPIKEDHSKKAFKSLRVLQIIY